MRKTYNDFGISIVLSTHLMNDVERTADRIVVLREGRVVEEGEVASFTTEKSETVYIEVNDRRDEWRLLCRRRGFPPEWMVHRLWLWTLVRMSSTGSDALAASGASLRRMGPRRRSLIEVFEDGGGKTSEASSRELSAESAGGGALIGYDDARRACIRHWLPALRGSSGAGVHRRGLRFSRTE